MNDRRTIVILGPTAGGKSELAVALAEQLDGEVLGADSMQVYRHLDAGTAKPEPELRGRVPHHLIDIVEPTDRFTAADWLERARTTIADLHARGKRAIVVGGTNLYLKLLLEGMFDAPAPGTPGESPAFRATLEPIAAADLHARLQQVDPVAADRIHLNDRKRLVRALEVHHLTGQPISTLQTQWGQAQNAKLETRNFTLVGLDWPREAINQRINQRVKVMFAPDVGEPLPDEVRRLEADGLLGPQAREALGYKQVLAALAAEQGNAIDRRIHTMDDAFEQTKVLTRRFAKQQRTWLRRYENVHWLPATELTMSALTERALAASRQ
ncbi:tRNA (adenosine(37)-N6)-dimethylallyltransferase MiaA [Phycisphaerales bacterium AB-hyl4]|uniref:tRNA dimethylallyltransferase n=1 Tax=Natronomicrosphaera hydrolytica TaxID=3242702 RepID=A0ABV4U7U4_9BACT